MKLNRQNLIYVVLVVIIYKIYSWGVILNITPDSASYISTSKHLNDYGKFINLTNWPSMTLMPIDEPFTDCAPGLPLILSVFFIILEEPLVSAYLLQSIFLVLFFYYLFKLFEILDLKLYAFLGGTIFIALFPMTSKVLYSFFAELPLVVSLFAILFYSIRMNNTLHLKNDFWYVTLALFLGSCFKYIGVFSLVPALIYLITNSNINIIEKRRFTFIYLLSGVLPVLIWFARNYTLYGYTTYSHNVGHSFDFTVFDSFIFKLSYIHIALPYILLIAFILSLVLLLLPFFNNKLKSLRFKYKGIYFAFIVNFIGIIFLSMIADFNELGPRLLFPSLVCLIICLFIVLDNILNIRMQFYLLITITFISLMFIYQEIKLFGNHFINFPKEKIISNIIINNKININSTHFYSEFDNYKLQVYLDEPIRFLNSYNFKNIDQYSYLKLKQTGKNPYFVFSDSSIRNKEIEPLVTAGMLEKIHLTEFNTTIYKFRN